MEDASLPISRVAYRFILPPRSPKTSPFELLKSPLFQSGSPAPHTPPQPLPPSNSWFREVGRFWQRAEEAVLTFCPGVRSGFTVYFIIPVELRVYILLQFTPEFEADLVYYIITIDLKADLQFVIVYTRVRSIFVVNYSLPLSWEHICSFS